MKYPRQFGSDNFAGVHPDIVKAMASANTGHCVAYGDDPFTESAMKKFQEQFGERTEVFFVFSGTGANVMGLTMLTNSFHAILCAETAHINADECGAPEKFTGCKLLTVPSENGKITIEQLIPFLADLGVEHHSQPNVISITQATEYGTVYTPEEIERLAAFAHDHGMFLHMDGARLCNAAATLDVNLIDITGDVGVDVLSFGGTKNGLMFGEAVVFFKRAIAKNFMYVRKQGMQLFSKTRFISAQFEAYLSNNLWLKNARHANEMATLLASELESIPEIRVTQQVQANAVFAIMPQAIIPLVQKKYVFYVWNEQTSEVRLMASFDTTKKDVKNFVNAIKEALKAT